MREYLRKIRQKKGLSQHTVAKELGICQYYYGMIERMERQKDLDLSLILKLSKLFDVSVDFIIAEEEKLKAR